MSIYFKTAAAALVAVFLLLGAAIALAYLRRLRATVWSVSIYAGDSPFSLSPHPLAGRHPVLRASDVTDTRASFVADPFIVRHNGAWQMFFEVFNTVSQRGSIGHASSNDGIVWRYERIVLDEPFHLSYPYVFEWNGSHYMIPESGEVSSVRLYRAETFPTGWVFDRELLSGVFVDSSVTFFNGKWWLFTLKERNELVVYHAASPIGPWTGHAKNPLIRGNGHITRPGGRLITHNGHLIRFAQDDNPLYGVALRAFQIDEITETEYREHELPQSPLLSASGRGWNATGAHHIDPQQIDATHWIACVDGRTNRLHALRRIWKSKTWRNKPAMHIC